MLKISEFDVRVGPPTRILNYCFFIVELTERVSADQMNCDVSNENTSDKRHLPNDGKHVHLRENAGKRKNTPVNSSGINLSGNIEMKIGDRPRFARHMDEHGRFHKEELHQCDTCQGMFLKTSYVSHVTYCVKQTSKVQLCGEDKLFFCKLLQT